MLSDLRKNYWVSQLASESFGLQFEIGCEVPELLGSHAGEVVLVTIVLFIKLNVIHNRRQLLS